jgi:proteasome accessory factor C
VSNRQVEPGSKWLSFKRCLAIVRRLQEGPASKAELVRAVRELVPGAYGAGSDAARRKRFERDVKSIREDLGVDVDYERPAGQYVLKDSGPLLSLGLSPGALRGLAFLLSTFDAESAASEQTRPLLETIQRLLPGDQLRKLERYSPELGINLHHLDQGEIHPRVWDTVQRAVLEHRVLQFDYVSPRHDSPLVRTHVVESYDLKFVDGHWQLHAYCRRCSGPDRQQEHVGWLPYRLTRVQVTGLELWPDKFPRRERRRRLVNLVYRLGPELHRGGVSRRFEEMEVSAVEADGWVTVTAKTDDLFVARRILLAYGENCQVLAPPQLRRQIARAAHKMAGFYADEETPPP